VNTQFNQPLSQLHQLYFLPKSTPSVTPANPGIPGAAACGSGAPLPISERKFQICDFVSSTVYNNFVESRNEGRSDKEL
jgi:hypothetical protein